MAEDEIIDAEVIDGNEVSYARPRTASRRQIDGLSLISFITSLVIFAYPFNAIIAIVLSITSRNTRRRSGRSGRGFARAAWIVSAVQLLLGGIILLALLLSPMIRANETSQPIPTQTPICALDLHDCELVQDGVDGAKTFGGTMKQLWEGALG